LDYAKLIQPLFALGLVVITLLVMFVPVPAANMDVFKTLITAIISFISGTVVTVAAMQHAAPKKEDKDEKADPAYPTSGA
jgi:hypothetical protein